LCLISSSAHSCPQQQSCISTKLLLFSKELRIQTP
jgi:hypothetical protein